MMEAIGKQETSIRCFFRRTTACPTSKSLDDVEYGHVRDAAFSAGCEYFDVAHVMEEFRMLSSQEFSQVLWDEQIHYVSTLPLKDQRHKNKNSSASSACCYSHTHSLVSRFIKVPWVYEELDQLLLNLLCNTQVL